MLKVVYNEVIKDIPAYSRPSVIERSKSFHTLTEAVHFSRYIANTTHVLGKPTVIDED